MLCRETTAVCFEKPKKNTLYGKNTRHLDFYKNDTVLKILCFKVLKRKIYSMAAHFKSYNFLMHKFMYDLIN